MNRTTRFISISFAVIVSALALLLALCSCSSAPSPQLNKDASLKTPFGSFLQFKINSEWTTDDLISPVSPNAVVYLDDNNQVEIELSIDNVNRNGYENSSISTYDGWLDSEKSFHSSSAPDRTVGYTGHIDDLPTYSDYSITEIGSRDVDGVKMRLYKQGFTITYSDQEAEKQKQQNSSFQNPASHTLYTAVVKDGSHDMEVSSPNERLLNNFLDTLSIIHW